MPESLETPDAPPSVKTLVDAHLNGSLALTKVRLALMAALTLFLPLAFHAQGAGLAGALFNSVVLWGVSFFVLRWLARRFQDLQAGQLAARIDRRVPADHPGRNETIQWIEGRNDGGSLNSLLQRLGGSLPGPQTFSSPAATTQVYTYTTNETKVLQDGEWVTVHSSTSTDGGGPSADEALEQALAMVQQMKDGVLDVAAEPPAAPADFKPIPISNANKKKKGERRRRSSGRRPLPLELDAFEPEEPADGEPAESDGVPAGARREGRER